MFLSVLECLNFSNGDHVLPTSQVCQAASATGEELGDAVWVKPDNSLYLVSLHARVGINVEGKEEIEPSAFSRRFSFFAFRSSSSVQNSQDLNRKTCEYCICTRSVLLNSIHVLDSGVFFGTAIIFCLGEVTSSKELYFKYPIKPKVAYSSQSSMFILLHQRRICTLSKLKNSDSSLPMPFLIPSALLVLVNSYSPHYIIIWFVCKLLNSGFCSDAVPFLWAYVIVLWVELEGETVLDWA